MGGESFSVAECLALQVLVARGPHVASLLRMINSSPRRIAKHSPTNTTSQLVILEDDLAIDEGTAIANATLD